MNETMPYEDEEYSKGGGNWGGIVVGGIIFVTLFCIVCYIMRCTGGSE